MLFLLSRSILSKFALLNAHYLSSIVNGNDRSNALWGVVPLAQYFEE
jgi:hypothetical protein